MVFLGRTTFEYENLSERFINRSTDYTKQYNSIYNVRLKIMRPILIEKVKEKWGQKYPVCRLHELSTTDFPTCIVIGTLFKDQKLKPSVLKQLAEANQLVPPPVYTHFTDKSDLLYIEDELQRLLLLGALNPSMLVTGISCALLGSDIGTGKFMVEDYIFADYRPQVDRPLGVEDSYILFVSGLDLMHNENSRLQLKLFRKWFCGALGNINEIEISKIGRLIIAGNSVRSETNKTKTTIVMTSRTQESKEVIEAVKSLDDFLYHLCQFMDVDIMPGENDPSNHVLPQKNMHHCMFPNSSEYKSMNFVSNPYECLVNGCRILGTSGQPVTDILRFSDIEKQVDVLESCLKWNHIAPTAPDTLGCFPYADVDPFILENCPHVFFTGNQDLFDTKLVKGQNGQTVRLISIPEFSSTFTVCVMNLKDLSCVPINLNK